jgi:hypothetical protein
VGAPGRSWNRLLAVMILPLHVSRCKFRRRIVIVLCLFYRRTRVGIGLRGFAIIGVIH